MKGLLKIYRNYMVTALLIFLLILVVNFTAFMGYAFYHLEKDGEYSAGKIFFRNVADEILERDGDAWKLSAQGVQFVESNQSRFLMLLSEEGEILYSWNLPGELKKTYSLSDVASFSRWYLMDYPVYVWSTEDGLLVAGKEKGSVARYNMVYSMQDLTTLMNAIPLFLLWNLFLFLLILLFLGRRFYRSLLPVSNGIEDLTRGKAIHLNAKGALKDLVEKLNQTSRLLQKQRKEIERRDNARTEWISGVSHDIRTPLSVIMGYADSLESDESLPAESQRQAGMIKEQSLKIKKLIEDLNLTSRLTYQMQPLRKQTYRPSAFIRKILTSYLNQMEEEKYQLLLEIDPRLESCQARGDVSLLERAVENLLNNSISHNPQGCRIWINATRKEERFQIQIRDDGVGIPGEVYRFIQGETNDSGKVHVMGLHLAKQIVVSCGGNFRICPDLHTIEMELPISD